MKLAALVLAWLCTGCLWANEKSDQMYGYGGRAMLAGDGHIEGAVMDAQLGAAGLYLGATGSVHDVGRPEDVATSTALAFSLDLKASLFGILGSTHELERYLDLGGEAGAGGILVVDAHRSPNPLGASAGYYGAWVEIGTVSIAGGYLAIVGDIRRDGFGAPWRDQTELTVGLAWRKRSRFERLHGHD
ncbi:MAG TPA: hypothetical protein VGC42_02750 [Kofleriaceae bacterium]